MVDFFLRKQFLFQLNFFIMVQIDFAKLVVCLVNRCCPVFMYSDGTVALELDLKKRLIGCWDNLDDVSSSLDLISGISARLENQLAERCFPFYVDAGWQVMTEVPADKVIGQIWGEVDSVSDPCDCVFPEVGWYAFADGKFSPEPDSYPNCWGVVGWVNPDKRAPQGRRGLIVVPDAIRASWSGKNCKTDIKNIYDGQSNMSRLLVYGRSHDVVIPAAEWCADYGKNGVKAGEVFWPAKEQLEGIVANRDVVNSALEIIGGVKLTGWIWTSCEHSYSLAVSTCADNGLVGRSAHGIKARKRFVRCVIAF